MKSKLDKLPRLRTFAFIQDLTGRSRSAIYRDIDSGALAKPIKFQNRNMWPEDAILSYYNKLTGEEAGQ